MGSADDSRGPAEGSAASPDLAPWLRCQVADLAGLAVERVAGDRPLSALGLDSLLMAELADRAATRFQVTLDLGEILAGATLDEVAARLAAGGAAAGSAGTGESAAPPGGVEPATGAEGAGDATGAGRTREAAGAGGALAEAPAPPGQRALWFVQQVAGDGDALHLRVALHFGPELDRAALVRAMDRVVARHEQLRAAFRAVGGEPWVRIEPHRTAAATFADGGALTAAELGEHLRSRAAEPFDLERDALVRLHLCALAGGETAVLVTVHHLVADLRSLAIVARDLGVFYRRECGADLPPPAPVAARYGELLDRRQARLAGAAGERLWEFWSAALRDLPAATELPYDRPPGDRPPVRGRVCRGMLAPELAAGLAACAAAERTTLFAALLAVWGALLQRLGGQADLVVGTAAEARETAAEAAVVGYFVNPLALRLDLGGEPGFRVLLARLRGVVAGGFAHRALPFPRLVERLRRERAGERSPLFQVMLTLHRGAVEGVAGVGALAWGGPGAALELGGLRAESIELPSQAAQFELELVAAHLDRGLGIALRYDPDVFDAATAARLLAHFERLVGGALAAPTVPLADLPWLAAGERHQLLHEWNDTAPPGAAPAGSSPCLHELVLAQAGRTPEALAVRTPAAEITYGELARRVVDLARRLRALGVAPEELVAVCVERTPQAVVALLGVLAAGGAYVPVDPGYPAARQALLLADAGARWVITEASLAARADFGGRRLVLVDQLDSAARFDPAAAGEAAPAAAGQGGAPDSRQLAYVIYTSGSTGRPKGVAIEHRSAVALVRWAAEVFAPEELAMVAATTSFSFDLSAFELFVPLSRGGCVLLLDHLFALPAASGATLVNSVPSVLGELLRQRPLPASVRTVNLAGEVFPRALARQVAARGAGVERILNLYGPSEDTTYSTWSRVDPGALAAPAVGRPIAGTAVHLLDGRRRPVALAAAGEIALAGAGLARGYLGQPALTAARFVPDPVAGVPGGRVYLTGDLGRRRWDGEIEFLGRRDQQVKVRGFRIELAEIETVLAEQVDVAAAAAGTFEARPGALGLAAWVVPAAAGAALDVAALRAACAARLPAAMVPERFVQLAALPLSSNGKLDRRRLPPPAAHPGMDAATSRTAPVAADPLTDLLAAIWAAVLEVPSVEPGDQFFLLGGHSLLATRVAARVREALGVELPLRTFFTSPVLADFAAAVAALRAANGAGGAPAAPPLVAAPGRPPAASFAQHRLWLLHQLTPASPAYNMAGAIRLAGELAPAALAAALAAVTARQAALRTTFAELDGTPVPRLAAAAAAVRLPLVDLAGLDAARRDGERRRLAAAAARRPFDLATGPLLRHFLVRLAAAEHVLVVTLHHVVADGWSLGVLVREVGELYAAAAAGRPHRLPELALSYFDFAHWQRDWLRGETLARELAHWRRQLGDAPPAPVLPCDRPRSAALGDHGGRLPIALAPELVAAARRAAGHGATTLFMVLTAALQALLGRYGGEARVTIGAPVANRGRLGSEGLIGLFVNTLVLAADLGGDPAFGELLAEVREAVLQAHAHQDLPFERLVDDLWPQRDALQPPFEVVLALAPEAPRLALPGVLPAAVEELPTGRAKFPLTFELTADPHGGLAGWLEWNAGLFDAATVARLGGHFQVLLAAAAGDAAAALSRLPLLTPGEAAELLAPPATAAGLAAPDPCLLHELFARQAARSPGAVAVSSPSWSLTYAELDEAANRLARHLRGLGVRVDQPLGLCLSRSPWMLIAVLGVLKAGGAYVPLDPEYPAAILEHVLADSRLELLLTEKALLATLPAAAWGLRVLPLDVAWAQLADDGAAAAAAPAGTGAAGDSLAYVIYTSGSTGMPKGVLVTHANVAHLLAAAAADCELAERAAADVWTLCHSYAFDFSVWEMWGALLYGGRLVVVSVEQSRAPAELLQLLVRERVTVLNQTPSAFRQLAAADETAAAAGSPDLALRLVIFGGEALDVGSLARWCERRGTERPRLVNMYGITETTVHVTRRPLVGRDLRRPWLSPIGKPLAHLRLQVLDRHGLPLPVGVPGELLVGGAGLARGYLRRPGLTAERFVPDPGSAVPGSRLYRSGDRVRRLADGDLEYLGRVDRQLKVRGFRIEPGEVEGAAAVLPAVGEVAVGAWERSPGDVRLVAWVVWRGAPDVSGLLEGLRSRLPRHMVPSHVVELAALPLTANGKLDRRRLPPPSADRPELAAAYVAPTGEVEERLAAIWRELLRVDRVGVDDSFFELGGHSLTAAQLASRVRQAFGVELPLAAVFAGPTVAELARRVAAAALPTAALSAAAPGAGGPPAGATLIAASLTAVPPAATPLAGGPPAAASAAPGAGLPPVEPAVRDGRLPLSFAQERLWVMDRLLPGNPVWNVFHAMSLAGPVAVPTLAASFAAVVRRHEVLRTAFVAASGKPHQVVLADRTLAFTHCSLAALPAPCRQPAADRLAQAAAQRPFDLAAEPLLRVALVTLDAEHHVLLLTMHHIVCDDWSIGLLLREVAAFYAAGLGQPGAVAPPPLPVQYADYAIWQRRWLSGVGWQRELAFWRRHLGGGELPVLRLPADRPRPAAPSLRGALAVFDLPAELSQRLRRRARELGSTVFLVLLTAYAAMLERLSGQAEIVIGCAAANRRRLELEALIGFFVNILPLRFDLRGAATWRELLARVRTTALAGYDHQDVPFDQLVAELQPDRQLSHASLRQVGFAFGNAPGDTVALGGGLAGRPLRVDPGVSRLDLTLFIWDDGENLGGRCEYSTDLFDAATIERWTGYFRDLVDGLLDDLDRPPAPAPVAAQRAAPAATAAAGSNLTESQQLFWFADTLNPDVQLYFALATTTFTVAGELDACHFSRAFQGLIDGCDSLRSRIVARGGSPYREVAPRLPAAVELVDVATAADPPAAAAAWLAERSARRLDLAVQLWDCALLRLGGGRSLWYWNVHHIVADAWSIFQTAEILSRYYLLSQRGELTAMPPLPSYELYAEHERRLRGSPRYERARAYWAAKLAAPWTRGTFYLRDTAAPRGTLTRRRSVDLGPATSAAVRGATAQLDLFSPAVVFGAVLVALLERLSGGGRHRVGTPFANRSADFAAVIGLQMNACPLAIDVAAGESFLSLVYKVQQETVETARHQFYPVRNPPHAPVYDVYLNYQNVTFRELCGMPAEFALIQSNHSHDLLDLQIGDFAGSGSFRLDFDLNLEAFDDAAAERTPGHYLRLLEALLADPGRPLAAAAMLSAAEAAQLVGDWNRTAQRYDGAELLLHELFERQARRTPGAVAVTAEEGALTYAELDALGNRLAHLLRRKGVGPDRRAGVFVERSLAMVVALVGILKAGGSYLPLDPDYPAERVEQMAADAAVAVVVTAPDLAPRLAAGSAAVVQLDGAWSALAGLPDTPLAAAAAAADTAYVIFTSGSTGKPKGAMVPHQGICNRLLWMQAAYGLTADDRVLQKTPFSFDVSVWELFWPLLAGARLVMARPGGHQDASYLVRTIAEHGITTLHFVPSMLQVFLSHPELAACGSLVRVMASGEALPESLSRRFFERLPAGVELHNLYGPTEASVDVTAWACAAAAPAGAVPIGRPIANTRIHLVDRQLDLVPAGIPGELCIGGIALARGYCAQPAVTAERFVPDPFAAAAAAGPGGRLYRTGDLARHRPDGAIEFLGRIDHQIKLRGFRIELGEIEAALCRHPQIREAVLTCRDDGPGGPRLVAYVTGRGAAPTLAAARSFLAARLPEHMLPAALVALPALPLNANGKVDRRALPAPEGAAAAAGSAFVPPSGPLEALLAGIWAEVLGVPRVSVEASFFELGGNSLLATQAATLVQEILPLELPLRSLFLAPTVAKVAALLGDAAAQLPPAKRQLMDETLAEWSDVMAEAAATAPETADPHQNLALTQGGI